MKIHAKITLGLGFGLGLFLAANQPAFAGDINIEIQGALPAKGGLIINLFDEETYLKEPLATDYVSINEDGTASATMTDLAPGRYALAVIHDKNGNQKMDTNFLGIPKEKGGFSNNAPAKMGPAKFKKAVFDLADEPVTQTIILRKAK